jgi:glycosyltransferase involved in cell wall biosynthesis
MKVVMVNDCAFVGQTLLKYLPPEFEKQHIKRGRGLWSKTFSLAYRILRAKGDVYHVNYLLQDCYIASRLGKHPLLGHGHGSDVRRSLHHPVWGRIVRHNLKHCDKVLVSTPDLLTAAQQYGRNVEYLPNPVDTGVFYPKPSENGQESLRVLVAGACDWRVKGTDTAIRALSELKRNLDVSIIAYGKDLDTTLSLAKSLGLHLRVLPKIGHEDMREYYWKADVVMDQFKSGVFGLTSLEAIACGRPTITYISSEYKAYDTFPLKDVSTVERVTEIVENLSSGLWQAEHQYLEQNHDPMKVGKRAVEIYNELAGR